MSWREELLPATYNGIPFYIDTESLNFGRRLQVNEYPYSDTPNTRNLGRKVRKYTVNAYVIGDEYLAARNALLDAVENTTTAGLLTLPTLAPVLVYPTDECEQTFNNRQGGIETFKLVFVEAGVNLFPTIGNATQIQAAIKDAEAAIAIYEDFKSRFATGNFPGFIKDDASNKLFDFTNLIKTAAQQGVASQSAFSNFTDSVTKFSDSITKKITDSDYIGTNIKDLTQSLTDIYTDPNDAYDALETLTDYGANYLPIAPTTPALQAQLNNQNALVDSIVNSALVQMALSTSRMTFASRQDAFETRDDLALLIRKRLIILSNNGNYDQFNALSDVLTQMINDINARSATLKNIVFISLQDSVPAIVFAYDNYGSADFESDVIARNNIRRPLFLPAGATLEVLK